MLLAPLARVSREVAETSGRTRKISLLAGLFRAAGPEDVPVVIPYLAGRLPQGRIGVGWNALKDPPPAAAEATLTVHEVDTVFSTLAAVEGAGAQGERRRLVQELLAAATAEEQRFLVGLISGEVRQGALGALAVEALAVASEADGDAVRRAVMLAGSLQPVAER
ncbi:ATP-dependent DNA ligase, partial [Streptomyces sp. AcH 505]